MMSKFFAHGEVSVLEDDPESGQASISICLPACVMQAVTPQLLIAGYVDSYEIRRPLAVWIPTIEDAGFRPASLPACARVNAGIRAAAKAALEAFAASEPHLLFPGDALPLLPMGTYVRFRLRGDLDSMAGAVPAMGGAAGVAELKYALASVLAALMRTWGRAGSVPPALQAAAGRRSSRPDPGQAPPSSS